MSNHKINLIANVILPIVVIALTVTLFLMFRPEETTTLFYLNLGYIIFLEIVFFGYLNSLYSKKSVGLSTPFYAVFGVYSMYYILLGLGCMLLYSLVLIHFMPIKVYVAAIIIITLAWIIISTLTAQTDSNYKETVDKLSENQNALQYYTQRISKYASLYEKVCKERGIDYETDSNNRTVLDRLRNKIASLTPNIFRSETAIHTLNTMLGKCEDIIEETETANDTQLPDLTKKMQRFVNNSIDELDMLKNITRK